MATVMESNGLYTHQIGETAGLVWHTLADQGPLTLTRLLKSIDAPRDVVLMSLGWLAREDKIAVDESKRARVVSLVSQDEP